jgi:hypothetical protein
MAALSIMGGNMANKCYFLAPKAALSLQLLSALCHWHLQLANSKACPTPQLLWQPIIGGPPT